MNIQRMSARYERSSRTLLSKLVTLFFLVPFVVILSTQSAQGQGFKITQLNAPGTKAGTTFPLAVNASQNVVGGGTATAGGTVGFLYEGGKYTSIKYPGSSDFTRALGINDSNEVVGDFFLASDKAYHGFTYIPATKTYKQYDVDLGKVSTAIFGVNSAGDCVGAEGNITTLNKGFVTNGCVGLPTDEFYASGTDNTFAYAINNSREVVGEYFDSSNLQHGFYRTPGGTIVPLNYPGATQTIAYGINDAGEITGYYFDTSGHTYGFTYIKGKYASTDFASTYGVNSKGAYVGQYWGVDGVASGYLASPQAFTLSTVKVAGSQQSQLFGVNSSGVSVGYYVASNGTQHGMMISAGKVENIDDPNGTNSICFGINSTNQIVGVYTNGSGNMQGFEYTAGVFSDIEGPTGAVSSLAFGINDAGDIAGQYTESSGRTFGFVLTSGKYKTLNVPGSQFTQARGINSAGLVTVQWGDSKGYLQSSLYDGGKYTPINVPGAAVNHVQGINTAGDIVYFVTDPYGVGHGALKSGNDYYIFDYPKGSDTIAGGINDSNLIVGAYIPSGKTAPASFQATE